MSAQLERQDYPDHETLAKALADTVADQLRDGIRNRGRASLAVSGGTTPRRFLSLLGEADLDWSCVSVILVDERWVPETSDRSNARMVRETLLAGGASAARFKPLYTDSRALQNGLVLAARNVASIPRPFDAVVLGMGEDGHTASFFPGGDRLQEAIDLQTPVLLVAMRARGAGEPRVTLTLPVLLATRFLALHIEGQAKADTLQMAQSEGPVAEMPVRSVLRQDKVAIHVFWCP